MSTTATRDPQCIFCKIVAGELPCHRVTEDEQTLVFMDIFPVSPGHTLIIPKPHAENLYEIPEEGAIAIARTARRVALAIRKALAPDGLLVYQLNGAAAGQSVFHYHMHLSPRSEGQELGLHTRVPGDPARLAEQARRIAAALD